MTDLNEQRRFRDNLQGEVDGAAVYAALAEAEKDPNVASIYRRLAAVERAHAEFWRSRLDRATRTRTRLPPILRARGLSWLAGGFGPSFVLPAIAEGEARDSSHYDTQPDAVAGGLSADERSHARIIHAASAGHRGLAGPALARLEGRHRSAAGNALRAAVLGSNDGLVSNLSLVMGIAGAAAAERTILLTGLAGLGGRAPRGRVLPPLGGGCAFSGPAVLSPPRHCRHHCKSGAIGAGARDRRRGDVFVHRTQRRVLPRPPAWHRLCRRACHLCHRAHR